MAKKRKRLQKSSSFFGALVIESLALFAMLGLVSHLQDQREQEVTVEELIKPKMVIRDDSASLRDQGSTGHELSAESNSSRRFSQPTSFVLHRLPKFDRQALHQTQ